MLVPVKWINDYVKVDMDGESYGDVMTMAGITLETSRHFGDEIENVVVGKVEKIEQHPNADKLVVCQVNIGKSELLQVVTGATNLYEGAYVPVALDNALVPGPLHGKEKEEGGTRIQKGALRGVESDGMLCGPQELGWDDKVAPYISKDGIWLLQVGDDKIGEDIVKALELDTDVVDLDVTPNRSDWLSMLGVAKDTKAALESEITLPDTNCECHGEGKASDYLSVEIRNDACKRYTARIITDVKIEQSPWWLQHRLMLAGQRPINNIVDITNFVMLEYAQPLHAFDIETVEDRKIIIDVAKKGDKFVTLDGKERELFEDTLMINDGKKPIAIAGVMGGLNSEIEETTKTVILESANFDADSVRISSKKLGLKTEAAARYLRGIDPNLCKEAADRFCRLVELTGAGKVVAESVDIYPHPERAVTCEVRVSRINSVIGIDISREQMEKYFALLDFKVEDSGNPDIMLVTPPTIRRDMKIEADYIEEVARLYGYDNIPMTLPKMNTQSLMSDSYALRAKVRDELTALGMNEIQTYSFVSPRGVDNLRLEEDTWERDFVKILNPLGEETSVMRTILMPNMLEVLGRNYARNNPSACAFEVGNTFMPNMFDRADVPDEQLSLCMGAYGAGEDFYSMKGRVVALLEELGIKDLKFVAESEYGAFHPGRCARIQVADGEEDMELGIIGEVHPDVAKTYGISERTYLCELNFELLLIKGDTEKHYTPLPKYPATSRDIALLVDENVKVGDIEDIIREKAQPILEKVKLFDVYRGKQVEDGKKSCAFALTYRAADKTLTDEEVTAVHETVLSALREKIGAVLREI